MRTVEITLTLTIHEDGITDDTIRTIVNTVDALPDKHGKNGMLLDVDQLTYKHIASPTRMCDYCGEPATHIVRSDDGVDARILWRVCTSHAQPMSAAGRYTEPI